jgi:hypothetical protein
MRNEGIPEEGGARRRQRGGEALAADEAAGVFDDAEWEEGDEDVDGRSADLPYGGLTMRELLADVMEAQAVFPNKIPKPKGLAKILYPELANAPPQYDHHYPFGLQPFDFDPPDTDLRPGHYRPSAVDRLLATAETDASVVLPPPRPLCSPSTWLDALQLPEDARMRRNPRFLRVLQEFSHPSKYTDKQKRQMLYAIKFGLACDPERAGYEGGKLPFTVPGFNPKEMTEGLADVSRPKISRSRLRGPGFMDHAY